MKQLRRAIEARDEWQMNAWKRGIEVLVGDDPREQLLGLIDLLDIAFNEPSTAGFVSFR